MSDHLAIGGVSLTLKALLDDRMEFTRPGLPAADSATVTISAPDVQHANISTQRLNLFMYHISENSFLKNQEIPGQGHPGDYGHPPLSLDLFYLFTAYSRNDEDDVPAHQVLGDAMRVLHDFPVITDALVRQRVAGSVPMLDRSLLGEFESMKITLYTMSIDEAFKIWSSLPDTNFRCSVAYQVSVVQIESRRTRAQALPVRERRVFALPLRSPQITEVFRDPPLNNIRSAVAAANEVLRIRGVNLSSTAMRVLLGGASATILSQQDQELTVRVPATLTSGAHPVQVVHDIPLEVIPGQPPAPHSAFSSNIVPFMLIPTFNSIAPLPSASLGATVTVNVTPPVRATQEAVLLLDDFAIPAIPVPHTAAPRAAVDFLLPGDQTVLPPKPDYLVRVRVDGGESRLTVNPLTQEYDAPAYEVTL